MVKKEWCFHFTEIIQKLDDMFN